MCRAFPWRGFSAGVSKGEKRGRGFHGVVKQLDRTFSPFGNIHSLHSLQTQFRPVTNCLGHIGPDFFKAFQRPLSEFSSAVIPHLIFNYLKACRTQSRYTPMFCKNECEQRERSKPFFIVDFEYLWNLKGVLRSFSIKLEFYLPKIS